MDATRTPRGQSGWKAGKFTFHSTPAWGDIGNNCFASATALQVRVLQFVSGDKEGVTSASRGDVSVAHALGKNFQIRGGLGYISAYSARENADDAIVKSPIRAGGIGLLLGVDLVF